MDSNPDSATLGAQLEGLVQGLARSEAATAGFARRITAVQGAAQGAARDLAVLERGFAQGLKRAFDGVALGGQSLTQVVEGLGHSLSRAAYNAAVTPVTNHLGGLMAGAVNGVMAGAATALSPFAMGGSFAGGRVMPFAQGGIVTGPTAFPLRGGTGLMGEAGPEAILPLARGADGRLGVRAGGGGGPVSVNVQIATPDVAGFARSQSQIAAMMARAVAAAARSR